MSESNISNPTQNRINHLNGQTRADIYRYVNMCQDNCVAAFVFYTLCVCVFSFKCVCKCECVLRRPLPTPAAFSYSRTVISCSTEIEPIYESKSQKTDK